MSEDVFIDMIEDDPIECLRSTPETDAETVHKNDVYEFVDPERDWVVSADFARRFERERNEAREENARLREAVKDARDCILRLLDNGHDEKCAWINYANALCTCGLDAGHAVLGKLQPFLTP